MPIYQKKNITESIKVAIWKTDETELELIDLLTKRGISTEGKPNISNPLKIKHWLATRLLVNEFFDDVTIIYNALGKPILSNNWFISISHSNEFAAIIVNKKTECGIDIEKISPKVDRIKHKFLNSSDLINITTLEELTLYWGAKEALYKYYGKKEVLFIEHLFINDFSINNTNFIGKINMPNFKVEVPMTWEKLEDFMLVYTM